MNRKGQALVEFVLILPIFILILLAIIDFGNIMYSKSRLENSSTDIVRMIESDLGIDEFYNDYAVEVVDYKIGYKKIIISSDVKINTPLLDRILGSSFRITTERVVPYE